MFLEDRVTVSVKVWLQCEGEGKFDFQCIGESWVMSMVMMRCMRRIGLCLKFVSISDVREKAEKRFRVMVYVKDKLMVRVKVWLRCEGIGEIDIQCISEAWVMSMVMVRSRGKG
ncbi:Protein-Glutamine Gamma-Glutamyltransferase 4 [Manis pentadactyla]|nr:Protein-Glutamine Gamma-Glutamyltransferase 4 [Manis pentadactyla]